MIANFFFVPYFLKDKKNIRTLESSTPSKLARVYGIRMLIAGEL